MSLVNWVDLLYNYNIVLYRVINNSVIVLDCWCMVVVNPVCTEGVYVCVSWGNIRSVLRKAVGNEGLTSMQVTWRWFLRYSTCFCGPFFANKGRRWNFNNIYIQNGRLRYRDYCGVYNVWDDAFWIMNCGLSTIKTMRKLLKQIKSFKLIYM